MRKGIERIVVFGLMIIVMGGCYPQAHILIVNQCPTAWFIVNTLEGVGQWKEYGPLYPSEKVLIPLSGVSGQENKFSLSVDGFKIGTGESIGSSKEDLWVYPYSGELTAPRHNYSWEIRCDYGTPRILRSEETLGISLNPEG